MQIKLNGDLRETEAASLGQLVSHHKLDPEAIVIELNGTITRKEFWGSTPLNNGDQVEIVAFVGGG